jgi:hypothetical protein
VRSRSGAASLALVSNREPPDAKREAVPHFPPPRKREAPSPYREGIRSDAGAPPAERGKVVVTRPEPPDPGPRVARRSSGDLGPLPPPPPEPAGILDEILRAFRTPATFVSNHLHLSFFLLVLVLGLLVGSCGRSILGGHFAQ